MGEGVELMPQLQCWVRDETKDRVKRLAGRRQSETGERWTLGRLIAHLVNQEWDRLVDADIIAAREAKARLRRELELDEAAEHGEVI